MASLLHPRATPVSNIFLTKFGKPTVIAKNNKSPASLSIGISKGIKRVQKQFKPVMRNTISLYTIKNSNMLFNNKQ